MGVYQSMEAQFADINFRVWLKPFIFGRIDYQNTSKAFIFM